MSVNDSVADKEQQLKDLIKKRGSIKGRLTKFKEFLNTLLQTESSKLTNVQIKNVSLRLDKFQILFSEFNDIQSSIELLSSDIEEQIVVRDDIENNFYDALSVAQNIVDSAPAKEPSEGSQCGAATSCSHTPNSGVKLPTIKLPTFDGNYLKWLEFRDTFDSLINLNDSIPNINKFHYLRSSLEGRAQVVIKSIEFTSPNYKVAWELLCERFNNKNILINNHLKTLFNIEPITRESYKALRYLLDHVSKNLRALHTLGLPTEQWDILIIYMVSTKLDVTTSRKWEELKGTLDKLPTLEEFNNFLRSRADVLETTQSSKFENKPDNKPNFKNYSSTKSMVTAKFENSKAIACCICGERHRVYQCAKFQALSLEDRYAEVNKFKLCQNCLRSGHTESQCRLKGLCLTCRDKHNTLMHKDTECVQATPVSLSVRGSNEVLLCTALVDVINPKNNCTYTARALLDTGSQSSFITDKLKKQMELTTEPIRSIAVTGINGIGLKINEKCALKINSKLRPFSLDLSCLVVPHITGNLPSNKIKVKDLTLPDNLELADPNFYIPSEIDLLLGADVFWDIVQTKRVKLGKIKPTLQDSTLGWLVSGPMGCGHTAVNNLTCNLNKMDMHESLSKFWEIEELPISSKSISLSLEEQLCETHFLETTKRLPDGKFSVKMPFREMPEKALGDSFYSAKSRFLNLEKKLNKDVEIKNRYSQFISEYQMLGHLSEVERPAFGYFTPHHAVLREKSETTKLRVVFDASAKTSSGNSLNDIQLVGPVVQSDLFSILLRFRIHQFVLTGDIEKMYRQIEIDQSQRHLQMILWRENLNDPIKCMELNTVTYGTASAPFLSTRCLVQLAEECPDETISNVIRRDFYMDDLNTGSDSVEQLTYIYQNVTKVLQSAHFTLRKFRTNCPSIFENTSGVTDNLDWNKEASVLGLNWNPTSDVLFYSTDIEPSDKLTKRTITSMTCKIFDPLGLLSACIIKAKILLQKLWVDKLDWDKAVPSNYLCEWSNIIKNISQLSALQIPRYALVPDAISVQLHCFVDAAQHAYGACVYLRCIGSCGNVHVQLLCAKARVGPIKVLTIPRMELSAALLGARLCSRVTDALPCSITDKTIWSDSTIVLGWLKTQTKNLKTFVGNRVNEIHDLTGNYTFMHVPTDQNPADLASRGVDPQHLMDSSLWWQGPSFLQKEPTEWPSQLSVNIKDLPELKVFATVEGSTSRSLVVDFERYSNFNKLKRIYGYVLRFINNSKKGTVKATGCLDVTELNNALTVLAMQCQLESFSQEISLISKGERIHHKSKLLPLNPFLDKNCILRVGGRINNSEFDYNKKHPILLSSKHHFTKLLMRDTHIRLLHAGPQLLLSAVREEFWPIGGRVLARSVVVKCVVCARVRANTIQPIMADLPAVRVTPSFAFYCCGVDFAGPFMISSKIGRGSKISKCFLALFVCLQTKAIHLEAVSSMSTDSFLLCLRRFVSRRGKPMVIYCDNGTNFVGANNELGRVLKSSRQPVSDFTSGEGIKFKFIPAYSPHFGGIWEAGVKSAKTHLKRVASNASLTFEELATLFSQIEAILNSRPLSPLSSDPTDVNALTPGHFLIGRSLISVPSLPVDTKRPNRYQKIEQIRQHFWDRWCREYVAELQHRTKWRRSHQSLAVGDLVVLKEDNLPPLRWRLGRVTKLLPGPDQVARVAEIYTANGNVNRAFHRICPLLTAPEDAEDRA